MAKRNKTKAKEKLPMINPYITETLTYRWMVLLYRSVHVHFIPRMHICASMIWFRIFLFFLAAHCLFICVWYLSTTYTLFERVRYRGKRARLEETTWDGWGWKETKSSDGGQNSSHLVRCFILNTIRRRFFHRSYAGGGGNGGVAIALSSLYDFFFIILLYPFFFLDSSKMRCHTTPNWCGFVSV